jgi:hypothetical protein
MEDYRNYPFMIKADIKLSLSYFFINPYRLVRKHLEKKGIKNPYQYGETPLKTLALLVDAAGGIQKYQYFADLGAGRGRACYFIQKKYQCKVFAFEQMSVFVNKGEKLFPKVNFILGDFLEKDLSCLDLIYLYGTMMAEKEIVAFAQKISKDTKVITISYPINDYDSRFKVIKKIDVEFPWGWTKGYVQCLRK